jgi:hypothetical protein
MSTSSPGVAGCCASTVRIRFSPGSPLPNRLQSKGQARNVRGQPMQSGSVFPIHRSRTTNPRSLLNLGQQLIATKQSSVANAGSRVSWNARG